MITIYIKQNQFAKNVDEFGNIRSFEFPRYRKLEDGTGEPINDYLENGFKEILLDEQYKDCKYQDFDENLEFSVEKYNTRKQKEKAQSRIAEIKPRLEQLSQDLIQAQVGAEFDDLEERKQEFQTLHNELRILLGKLPRQYN